MIFAFFLGHLFVLARAGGLRGAASRRGFTRQLRRLINRAYERPEAATNQGCAGEDEEPPGRQPVSSHSCVLIQRHQRVGFERRRWPPVWWPAGADGGACNPCAGEDPAVLDALDPPGGNAGSEADPAALAGDDPAAPLAEDATVSGKIAVAGTGGSAAGRLADDAEARADDAPAATSAGTGAGCLTTGADAWDGAGSAAAGNRRPTKIMCLLCAVNLSRSKEP